MSTPMNLQTVLLISKDSDLRVLLQAAVPHAHTHVVHSVCEGLALCSEISPDLIIGEGPAARSVKIEPTGALLKYSFVESSRIGSASASTWLGNVPASSKAVICCSGAVSQRASARRRPVVLAPSLGRLTT